MQNLIMIMQVVLRLNSFYFLSSFVMICEKICPGFSVFHHYNSLYVTNVHLTTGCLHYNEAVLLPLTACYAINLLLVKGCEILNKFAPFRYSLRFLTEASFGLRVLSSPKSVYLSVCVCVSITCLSAR